MQESGPTSTDVPPPGGRLLLAAAGLAALLAVALACAPMLSPPLRLGLAAALGGGALVLAGIGYRRQREALAALAAALRALGQQRSEARAPSDLPGAFAAMAGDLNRIAARLAELHGEVDTQIAAQVRWLKRERDDLAAQNQQLRGAAAREQDEARAQSERLSSMSHELRTPLTGILGYADLMRRTRLDAEQLQQLNTIDQSARALLTMINDLLDWSRIEAGRLKLDEARFDLLDTIESTITLLAPLAYDKNLELVRIIYHDVPRELQGDAQRLRQILTNLLSNAIKFTERGEVVLRVMSEREESGRTWLRFAVTDSGVGISADQQTLLFRPFSQVGRAQAGGSGLGLSITRKLVELVGGEIGVESTPGQGSTFSTLLPYKLISADASSPHDQQPLGAHRVWLLEPHAAAKLALMHGLEFWGLTVENFADITALADALAASSAAGRPELICLGLDAQTLTHPDTARVLGLSRDTGVPTLTLVNSVNPSTHEALRSAGARISHPKSVARQQLYRDLDLLLHPERDAPQPLGGRRALVADNNLINRRYLALMCKQLGLDTSEAADGRAAYEQWRSQRPDIVLLDARMPRLDGPGCARAIREVEASSGTRCRIVAVSAHLEPDERRNFLAAGADAVLIKPFDEAQLLAALEPAAITQRHAATKLAQDPELASLLREELPLQFAALEHAIQRETLDVARDAAHTLRGTAAFYHLAQLRQTAAAVEEWLRSADSLNNGPETRRKLDRVRSAVGETLAAMQRER